jgi:hypothetical protein
MNNNGGRKQQSNARLGPPRRPPPSSLALFAWLPRASFTHILLLSARSFKDSATVPSCDREFSWVMKNMEERRGEGLSEEEQLFLMS